ncbi:hypothetical protein MNBD_GAMMA17-1916 [hydrothermal vent metagenome]|uniref:Uncharacterized protein n=1 Tax=hydrothermal vent metagenome TaxID=652676 RepID=A0A3B0Z1A2_9ZZZZ
MNAQLKLQISYISVVNFGNSPAITCYLRLDVTNLEFNLPRPELIEVPLTKCHSTRSIFLSDKRG